MARPRDSLPYAARRASFAKAIGSFVPGMTRKSFEKYGFSTVTLLTDWVTIAGRDLASFTLPERLKWPRRVEAFDDVSDGEQGRPGATLVLRVDGPRAIELQYQTRQIIERINAHFGYRAVSEIRFIQAPLPKRESAVLRTRKPDPDAVKPRVTSPDTSSAIRASKPAETNSALLASLDRLHANMIRASKS